MGITTSASRMTWAFARDIGIPFSSSIKKVTKHTRAPVIAIGVVTACAVALTLIYIGSPVAFNDVISLTITGFYGSYFVPAALLLYRRIKGEILPHKAMLEGEDPGSPDADVDADAIAEIEPEPEPTPIIEPKLASPLPPDSDKSKDATTSSSSNIPISPEGNENDEKSHLVAYVPSQLYWGPWHIPGLFGILNNAYACAYMIFVIFWSVWPPQTPVSPASMNYSVLVTGGVILFSIFWYYVRGRREYCGPLLEKSSREVRKVAAKGGAGEAVAVVDI